MWLRTTLLLAMGPLLACLGWSQSEFDAREFKRAFAAAKQPRDVARERARALRDIASAEDPKHAALIVRAARQLASEVEDLEAGRRPSLLKGSDPSDHDRDRADLDANRELEEQLFDVLAALPDGPLVDALLDEALDSRKAPAGLRLALARRAAKRPEAREQLLEMLLRGRKMDELVPALVALVQDPSAFEGQGTRAAGLLQHDDPLVRRMAARALVGLRQGAAIPALVKALDDPRECVRRDVADGLEDLTGQRFGQRVDAWRAWLEKEGGALVSGEAELPKAEREAPRERSADGPQYHGLPLEGEHIVFIIDRSLSMEWSLAHNEQPPAEGEPSRWERAISELKTALSRLRSTQKFTIVTFAQKTDVYSKDLESVTERSLERAYDWLDDTELDYFTNIHDALQLAFTFTGREPGDGIFSTEVDTIYLLTDGEPTVPGGRGGRQDDPQTILRAVRRWNLLQQVTVHVIGLGDKAPEAFLARLAEENNGGFVRERS